MKKEDNFSHLEDVVMITASIADWTKSIEEWRVAYFELLSLKNTFSGIWLLDLPEAYDTGVYVRLVISPELLNTDKIISWMEDLGYTPKKYTMEARIIDPVWNDNWEDDDWFFLND